MEKYQKKDIYPHKKTENRKLLMIQVQYNNIITEYQKKN